MTAPAPTSALAQGRPALMFELTPALDRALWDSPYALFEPGVDALPTALPHLAGLAAAILDAKGPRGLVIDDSALVFDTAQPPRARASIRVVFTTPAGDVDQELVAVAHAERARQLYQALEDERHARRKRASRVGSGGAADDRGTGKDRVGSGGPADDRATTKRGSR
jgi:hypothetical protein